VALSLPARKINKNTKVTKKHKIKIKIYWQREWGKTTETVALLCEDSCQEGKDEEYDKGKLVEETWMQQSSSAFYNTDQVIEKN
jgi:hypothetical protein